VTVSHLSFQDVGFAFKSSEFTPDGIRLLRGENIAPGTLRWTDTRCWPKDRLSGFEQLLVEEGDVILAMDRPVISNGLKIARAKASDVPCLLVQRMMRFRMVEQETADYLYLCLQHRDFIAFLTHDGMTGSDLPHITGTGVAEFPVPLPPIEEQREIVRRVRALFALAIAIEKRVAAATLRVEKLIQAILAKAFRGELVPTEAELARQEGRDYEPASVLLERIRAERNQGNGAETPRRTRPRKGSRSQNQTGK
jgi:type I restriction enzyme S subunit